jgi:ADP-ribose pyrophosphatase YjhB (NUDIX family)
MNQEDIKNIRHRSAGAIIKDEKGRILMLDRKLFPFGWACPAGHVDAWETPEEALSREVKEETNLDVKRYRLLYNEFIDWNECSRGIKGHDWYLYEIDEWSGTVLADKEESKKMEWKSIEDIKNLELDDVWKYWFNKLEII